MIRAILVLLALFGLGQSNRPALLGDAWIDWSKPGHAVVVSTYCEDEHDIPLSEDGSACPVCPLLYMALLTLDESPSCLRDLTVAFEYLCADCNEVEAPQDVTSLGSSVEGRR